MKKCLQVTNQDNIITVKEIDCHRHFRRSDIDICGSTPVLTSLLDFAPQILAFMSYNQHKSTEDALVSELNEMPLRLPFRDSSDEPPTKTCKNTLDFLVFTSKDKCKLKSY